MTIENNLASIAKSLELIAAALTQKNANPTPVAAPAQPVSIPVVAAPVAAPVVQQASAMPAPPVFTPAVPVQKPLPTVTATTTTANVASPSAFADKQAMMDFVISSYKALGAEKGAKIQDVLTSIGYKNINDVPPEAWGNLKVGIEALA